MNWGEPVPRTKSNFEKMVTFAKKRIGEVIIELSNSLTLIAESYHDITLALKKQKHLPPMVSDDIDEQLELLLPAYEPPLFIYDQIKHFPRYLAALRMRIEKYTQRQEKDEEVPDMYVDFQYALQELRVSLFAQELKTLYPISQKRVEKQWHEIMLK
jgi:ATP-dependent helicase HrpA